jgi:predicted Ser/Thr protein kinase
VAVPTPATWVVEYAAFALLNLCVAVLLGGVRPRRLANIVAAVMFGANAVQAAATGVRLGFLESTGPVPLSDSLNLALNAIVFAGFLVFPFVFPRRRLSPRWERALFVGAGAWAASVAIATALFPFPYFSNNPHHLWANLLAFTPFFGALVVGTVLLLDTYLTTPSATQRNQARYILAAYVLKLGAIGTLPPFATPIGAPIPAPFWLLVLDAALLGTALLVVPLAIASARLRGGGARAHLSADLLVLGMFPLLIVFTSGAFSEWEYSLVRPLLFAYAILRYQLLEVDVRERRAVVGATLLAGMAAVFVSVVTTLTQLDVDSGVATAVGFAVTVGAVGLLTWPLLQWLIAPAPGDHQTRDRELYRAALEEAVAANAGHDSTQDAVLRALRAKLAISDREHAVMEAGVRASFGKPSDGVAAGQTFLRRYRVERLLGEGGFGRTFLAHDEQVGRKVVLKAARVADAHEAKRLLREARVVARLHHPSVVTVFDVEQVAGDVFLVMEYVEGGSLQDRLRSGPLAWPEAAAVLDGLLAGLEAAHAKGILHRDLKPANILLTLDGRAKLADFGIARGPAGTGTVTGLSTDGRQPGSVPYMSPEQVRGKTLDARSDLYSLGVVGYEMVAGQPYLNLRGRDEFDVRLAILEEAPKLPLAGVPSAANEMLAELLAKEPAKRPPTAADVRRRLAQVTPAR